MINFILAIIFVIFLWYYKDSRSFKGCPPGPMRHPFIGNLLAFDSSIKNSSLGLHQLSKKYGDVMHIRMGIVDAVVVGSHSAVTEMLQNDNVHNIAAIHFIKDRNLGEDLGVVFCNGDTWQTTRRYTIRTLREFGFGKSSLSTVVQEEANKLVEFIKTHKSGILEGAETLFDFSSINVLWRLVTGSPFQLNDDKVQELLRLNRAYFRLGNFKDLSMAYPWMYNWFPKISKRNILIEYNNKIVQFLTNLVEEYEEKCNPKPECFIDCFLSQIGKPYFTRKHLVYLLLDLFQAGSDTSSNVLSFSLLYLILHPQVQDKVQQELDVVKGNDKTLLPYSYATLLECLRCSSIIPIPAPRLCSNEFWFQGWKIKKGTLILPNLHGAHVDDRVWGDPENFRPERFLKNGTINKDVADKLVVFGKGKRVCLGQSLAESTMFGILATLLRNFTFKKHPEDENISAEPCMGFTYSPQPFRCCFEIRKSK